MLAELLEIIGNTRLVGKIDRTPRFRAQHLSNLDICWVYLRTKIDMKVCAAFMHFPFLSAKTDRWRSGPR